MLDPTNLLLTALAGVFAVFAVLVVSVGLKWLHPRSPRSEGFVAALPAGFLSLHLLLMCGYFLVPLSSGYLRVTLFALAVVAAVKNSRRMTWRFASAATGLTACASLVVIALTTVTNYDAGLYYHSAIAHLRSDHLVLGLANLHHRLGNWSGSLSLSAFMQSGAWSSEAYRLANVVAVMVALAGLWPRVVRLSTRIAGPGDVLAVVAVPLCLLTLLGSPGFYLSAPTPDTGFALFGALALASLVDAVTQPSDAQVEELLVWSALALVYRPTGFVLLFLGFGILGANLCSRRCRFHQGLLVPLITVAIHVVMTFGLTGFPVFPVSELPEVVSWAVPRSMREYQSRIVVTIAREAGEQVTGSGRWSWLSPWLSRNGRFVAEAGVLFVAGLAVMSRGVRGRDLRVAFVVVLLTSVPVAVWFLLAPDPRFGLGLVFGWAAAPLALAVTRCKRGQIEVLHVPVLPRVAAALGALTLSIAAVVSGGSTTSFVDPTHLRTPKQVVLETDGLIFTRPLSDPGPQCGAALWCSPEDVSGLIIEQRGPFVSLARG